MSSGLSGSFLRAAVELTLADAAQALCLLPVAGNNAGGNLLL
ncbi:hypothetical protein [Sphingomonas sp. IC4-52]|nr:hypothetical protein [Sphingomonas sp. IC4-52]